MESSQRRIYIVLGAHRSGTSFLTKCLIGAGVEMGGMPIHYESGRFVRLNEEILQAAGGNWKNPPSPQRITQEAVKRSEDIASLLSSRQDMSGWKDPRQALTISSFLPHLDGDVYLIAIFRKSEMAGKSLERLGQVSAGTGSALVREYQHRILNGIKEFIL
jgi:hypothetical protein